MPLHDNAYSTNLTSLKYTVTDTYVSDLNTNLQTWLYTCRSIERGADLLLELPGTIGVRTD
jgi:hypothetical protein